MTIDRNFYLPRFDKTICEDGSMFFLRWETPKADQEPKVEIRESPLYYGGRGMISYVINVPRTPRPVCTGSVILIRTCANRYRVAAQNGKHVQIETVATLKEVEQFCGDFFK